MRKLQLVLPNPHRAQRRLEREQKRFNAVCCGRRWGKTKYGINKLTEAALGGHAAAWFAPSYKLLDDAWRDLDSTLKPMVKHRDASKHRLELYGKGEIECWSLDDPDAGRGRAYKTIVVDEAAMVKNLEQAWQQTIRPMLSDFKGNAWFFSTPKGIASYFHTLFQRGQDPAFPKWASWQMPTSTNPFIAPSEILEAQNDLTDLAFAQEYLAQFVSWAGQVFRRIMDACTTAPPGQTVMIGVDWGRTGDFTVFTGLSAAGEVTEIDRFRGLEYHLQRDRLQSFWERQGGQKTYQGPTAPYIIAELNSMGAPVVEQLQLDGLPVHGFQTTNSSKASIIQALALAFERGVIKIPHDPVLVGELQAFEGKPMAGGLMRYGAPEGLHDDMVMSLAMGWVGLLMPGGQQMFANPSGGPPTSVYPGGGEISPV